MDTSLFITEKIKDCIGAGAYNFWTIGVTDDPNKKKEALDHPPCWQSWAADTATAAKNILSYFLKEYPAGPPSVRVRKDKAKDVRDDRMVYVYIF